METTAWGVQYAQARRRLLECGDFTALRECGHDLKDGAVITSASDVPFQTSMKCAGCREIFWFDNLGWRTGGMARWRLSAESRGHANGACNAKIAVAPKARADRRFGLQP
jgi:hypothetical protein